VASAPSVAITHVSSLLKPLRQEARAAALSGDRRRAAGEHCIAEHAAFHFERGGLGKIAAPKSRSG